MKNIINEIEKKLEINKNYIFQLVMVNFKHFETFPNHAFKILYHTLLNFCKFLNIQGPQMKNTINETERKLEISKNQSSHRVSNIFKPYLKKSRSYFCFSRILQFPRVIIVSFNRRNLRNISNFPNVSTSQSKSRKKNFRRNSIDRSALNKPAGKR